MTHQAPGQTAPSPHPASAEGEPPRWTLERMRGFIETLRRTRSVAAAARSVGMSRQAAYVLRRKLPGHPWVAAWDAALAPARQEREAFRRMTAGYARLQGVTPDDAC
ncbi:MAG: LysR family transcriptional regulator [Novosphingobium sp.]